MKNKKIKRDILNLCKTKKINMHDRDKLVIEALLTMATDTKMPYIILSTGDCCIKVDRDENGIVEVHDYKPFRYGYSKL